MFEGILASVLNRYLSNYIDEVDYNNLKLGIFSGTLELLNVKVKPSALYQFDLPVDVRCGTIGKLKINISWKNIMNKPAVAEIEDLFVLLGPFEDKIHDPVKIEEMIFAHKKKQLEEVEKIDKTEILENKEKGYVEKVTDTIINNIQIYIKNVHIRYEDKHSLRGKTISFGIYLKEFRAETVDANGKANFLNADEKIVYKLGSLKGFNVYWNCSNNIDSFLTTKPDFNPKNDKTWVTHLRNSIDTRQIFNLKFENFIENNLDLENRLTLRRSNQKKDSHLPKITFQSSVNAIDFVFQRIQYKTILELIDYYSLLNVHKRYVKYRPKESKKNAPKDLKLWWQYIFTALAETTWRPYKKERMLHYFKMYKSYLTKYEYKLMLSYQGKEITPKEATELELLEKFLTIESIFDLRSLCKENVQLKIKQENEKSGKYTLQEAKAPVVEDRPENYVEFRFLLNFPFISLKLKNNNLDILKINFTDIVSKFEIRPVKNNFYFLLNTRGIDVFGIYYKDSMKKEENVLVPIAKSNLLTERKSLVAAGTPVTLLASEDAKDVLFIFCFETNPLKIEDVEYSIRTKISSLEVTYEKTAITEILRFFKTDLIDFEEVRKISDVWSRAGLIYAVENHKQIHVKAELSSPYFIIPVKGTSKEEGTSIVFFLGETRIISEIQPKQHNYTPSDIHDLEKNFYDKFILTVENIQVLLIPNGVDWKKYLSNKHLIAEQNFKYHILYPVSTANKLYMSINPSYKKLPKLKIDASTESIKLNFSDSKIIKLAEFAQNFPLPEIPKTNHVTTINSIGSTVQTPIANSKKLEQDFKKQTDLSIDSIKELRKKFKLSDSLDGNKIHEPDDEWDGPFNLPMQINGDPIPNYSQLLFKFTIGDFIIDLDLANDRLLDDPDESEYLELKFKTIKIDFAITKYGILMRAGLGDLKLIDKIHNDCQGTEILSSSTNQNLDQLIKFYFRQVEPEAPNFATLYSNILTNILFDCSNIHLACHREIIIYFLKYAKGITDNLTISNTQLETSDDTVSKGKDSQKIPANVPVNTNSKKNTIENVCEFNLIAKMNKLSWKMYDTNISFGDMQVNELSLNYELSGSKTDLRAKLKEIIINYQNNLSPNQKSNINKNFTQIISCTADEDTTNFFDFNLILYDTETTHKNPNKKDLIALRVGKIKIICLVKFVNELVTFMDPIVTSVSSTIPTLTEQVKEQAIVAVKNAYQETQNEGRKIYLDIHVRSPQVVIPKNSRSSNAFLIDLGNLSISNRFIDGISESSNAVFDEISLFLENVEIKRITYQKTEIDNYEMREQLIEPMNLKSIVKRTLTPNLTDPDLEIKLNLIDLKCLISLQSAKLLFAILSENLNEGMNSSLEPSVVTPVDKNETIVKDTPSTGTDKLNLKLTVELDKIKLIIVELKTLQLNESYTATYSDFSLLQISHLLFDYSKYENSSWDAEFKMKALKLNDLRPDSNLAVKEMFVPKTKDKNFIFLRYSVDTDANAQLHFELDHLKINLCLPYILKLYSMVMEAINTTDEKKNEAQEALKNITTKKSKPMVPVEHLNRASFSYLPEIILKENEKTPSLNVKGIINLPEIVLFAEPEKTNSKILIMNVRLNLDFKSKANSIGLEIELVKLGMRLGEFNNQKLGVPFLSDSTVQIKMNQTDPKLPAHYKVYIRELNLNVTPTLYEVVVGAINTLNKSGTEKIQKESEIKKLLEDSEPFKKHKIDKNQYKLNGKNDIVIQELEEINLTVTKENLEIENFSKQESNKNVKNKIQKVIETLDLKIDEVLITFCEETGMELQPLAIIKFELNGRVSNWTKKLHMKANLTLEASYYNDRLSNWEPFIENFLVQEDLYRPWIINLWFVLDNGGILQPPIGNKSIETIDFPIKNLDYSTLDTNNQNKEDESVNGDTEEQERENFDFSQATYILIESNDIMSINITPSAFRVMMYLAYNVFGTKADKEDFVESSEKPALKFLNFMGESCDIILPSQCPLLEQHAVGFNLIKSDITKQVSNLDINSFETTNALIKRTPSLKPTTQTSQSDPAYIHNYKFQLQLDGYEKCKLSMKYDGCFLFQLRDSPNKESLARPGYESIKYNIMYQVKTLYGRTKVIFSSPLKIENNCQIKILILIELTDQISMEDKEKLEIINEIKIEEIDAENKLVVRKFAVIFRLLPDKIYHVPLYVAYKCKLYATPDNNLYCPSLIFDIRAYNFRVSESSYINCKRISNNQIFDASEVKPEDVPMLNNNDFQFLRFLTLNVKEHRNIIPSMHANYNVALFPSMKISNCLPISLRIDFDDEKTPFSMLLKEGENINVHLCRSKLKFCKIHIINYLGTSWVGTVEWDKIIDMKLETEKIEMILAPTNEMAVFGKHLSVYLNYTQPNEFTFYSPYWLVNKSGQPIKIRSSLTQRTFDIPDDTILLFDYKRVNKNNKVMMNVNDGKWSKPFSLETAGTTGMVHCKDENRTYNFLMRITMSNSSRSKLVTFAPFMSIVNELDENIFLREWHRNDKNISNHDWKLIEPIKDNSKPTAIWPNAGEGKEVFFVIKLQNGETKPFPLENPGRFVLVIKNTESNLNELTDQIGDESLKKTILTVLISGGSQNPVTIVVRKYQYGDSVAKFVNLCDNISISIKEKKNEKSLWFLEPLNSMFFVWPELTNSSRELEWTIDNNNESYDLKLTKSSNEQYKFTIEKPIQINSNLSDIDDLSENDTRNLLAKHRSKTTSTSHQQSYKNYIQQTIDVSCVSYVEGTQRVVVFTTDPSWAEIEQRKEASSMEIFLNLKGIQISLINSNLELAVISIKDSNSIWSLLSPGEIKIFSNEYSNWLEKAYSKYLINSKENFSTYSINDSHVEINFDSMIMNKPQKGALKRSWHPGLLVQYRTSTNMTSIKLCVYKIQIDNQLPDAYFPICFYQVPTKIKETFVPFLSLSLFTEQQEVTQIYRCFDCILQEFYFKMDKGFMFTLKGWYDAAIITVKNDDKSGNFGTEKENQEPLNLLIIGYEESETIRNVQTDIKLTKEIMEYVNQSGVLKQSAHIRFDNFYISPILFNLSFSVNGTTHISENESTSGKTEFILNFFLESIGATITEFKDVKFQFKMFNINGETKTWKELQDDIYNHYKIQILHQAYVLILGLDVLGNPFGLVSDFSQGVIELLYDPLLGYFSKSNETDKLDLEMSSKIKLTINKTVSSAASSGSLITGSVARILATCTLDKNYKRKRQYKLAKTSTASFTDTLTIAGKGVVSGLVNGVIGVVKDPIDERKNGPAGIMRGVGKGFLGLFVKPIGSLFDGVSLSLDGIKRISQSGSEKTENIRLPRHLIEKSAILPYSNYQAKGYEILRDLQNDDIAVGESYWAHLFFDSNSKTKEKLLFITDWYIYKLKKTRTQILKKWSQYEKPIPVHKIKQTKIVSEKTYGASISTIKNQKSFRNKNTKTIHTEEIQLYHLFVSCSDKPDYDFTLDHTNILLTHNLETVKWFSEKINSAIKYYKELRNIIE